jgi:hypothetical protein
MLMDQAGTARRDDTVCGVVVVAVMQDATGSCEGPN